MSKKSWKKKWIIAAVLWFLWVWTMMGLSAILVPIIIIVIILSMIFNPLLAKWFFGDNWYSSILNLAWELNWNQPYTDNTWQEINLPLEEELRRKVLLISLDDAPIIETSKVSNWMKWSMDFLSQTLNLNNTTSIVSLMVDWAWTYEALQNSNIVCDSEKLRIDSNEFILSKNQNFLFFIQTKDGQYDDYLKAMYQLYQNQHFFLIYPDSDWKETLENYKRYWTWYNDYITYIEEFNKNNKSLEEQDTEKNEEQSAQTSDKQTTTEQNKVEVIEWEAPETQLEPQRENEVDFIKRKINEYIGWNPSEDKINEELNKYFSLKNKYGYNDYMKIYDNSKLIYEKYWKSSWDKLNDNERIDLWKLLIESDIRNKDILVTSALYYFVKDNNIDSEEKLLQMLKDDNSVVNKLLNKECTNKILKYIEKKNKNWEDTTWAIVTANWPVRAWDLIGYQSNVWCTDASVNTWIKYEWSWNWCHIHLEISVYKDGIRLNKTWVPRVAHTLAWNPTEWYWDPWKLFDYWAWAPREVSQTEFWTFSHNRPWRSAIDVVLARWKDTCGVPIYSPADWTVNYIRRSFVCFVNGQRVNQLSISVTWKNGPYTYEATFDHTLSPEEYYSVMKKY